MSRPPWSRLLARSWALPAPSLPRALLRSPLSVATCAGSGLRLGFGSSGQRLDLRLFDGLSSGTAGAFATGSSVSSGALAIWQAPAEAGLRRGGDSLALGRCRCGGNLRLALGDLRRLRLRRRFQLGGRRLDLRLVCHRLGRLCRRLSAGAFRLPARAGPQDRRHDRRFAVRRARRRSATDRPALPASAPLSGVDGSSQGFGVAAGGLVSTVMA